MSLSPLRQLKHRLGLFYKRLVYHWPFSDKQIILCRSACLGHEIWSRVFPDQKKLFLICQQKTRLDDLLLHLQKPDLTRVESSLVKPFLSRPDIANLIDQQAKLPWLRIKKFDYLLMDSFSELTDKEFRHREKGWSFFAHYSDLKHPPEFERLFEHRDVIPLQQLEKVYTNFFRWFTDRYPQKKVVFIHYPTALEQREEYRERGREILRVMQSLQAKWPQIMNLSIDQKWVDWKGTDRFPYHYAEKTNAEYAREWQAKIRL